MDKHRRFLDQRHFPLLDGLRCLAIVSVVWFHAVGPSYGYGVLGRGSEGVSLFFVISGFLITTLLLRERSETGHISLKSFYLRRTLRIFPVYYGMLGLYVILVVLLERHTEPGQQFWHNLPFFATYTSNWFVPLTSDRIMFFFAWSLATEEQFYLFWPWVIRKCGVIIPLVIMGSLIVLHDVALSYRDTSMVATVLASISPYICAGSLAAIALHHRASFKWACLAIGWRGSALVALGATIVTLAFNELSPWCLVVTMTWFVSACVLRPTDQPLSSFLIARPIKHIGTVSYGIYLMHILCINVVRQVVHLHEGLIVFMLALPLSIGVATLSFRFYETPFLRLKTQLGKKRRDEAKPSLTPAEPIPVKVTSWQRQPSGALWLYPERLRASLLRRSQKKLPTWWTEYIAVPGSSRTAETAMHEINTRAPITTSPDH
jgi:peptidoglycan/LPS O-acetylase OafA/YrhL